MNRQTITLVFAASTILTIVCFWLHRRLAGDGERPGAASMTAFVMGWLSVLTAICTGAFLLLLTVGRS